MTYEELMCRREEARLEWLEEALQVPPAYLSRTPDLPFVHAALRCDAHQIPGPAFVVQTCSETHAQRRKMLFCNIARDQSGVVLCCS